MLMMEWVRSRSFRSMLVKRLLRMMSPVRFEQAINCDSMARVWRCLERVEYPMNRKRTEERRTRNSRKERVEVSLGLLYVSGMVAPYIVGRRGPGTPVL